MPELPEVELARKVLAGTLVGARLARAEGEDRLVVHGALSQLVGRTVVEVRRRGKQLRVAFDADGVLVFSHLGMTGEWVDAKPTEPALRFERLRLDGVRKGKKVSARYVDARRLGRFQVAAEDVRGWKALGPDALEDGVDAVRLRAAFQKRPKTTVKELLLDQRVLAGVGNIYAIEALWRAKLDPRSRAAALSLPQVRAVAKGVHDALALALEAHAGPRAQYVNQGGPNRFKIYGHAGESCPRCKTTLAKTVLGGRGTTFCPGCQVRVQ